MKMALIGHGSMGQLVAHEATKAGAEIGTILTSRDVSANPAFLIEKLRGHDVAIDFSIGERVLPNVEACMRAGVPLVEGTTGWKKDETSVKSLVLELDGALVYGANFSVGVNLLYRVVDYASKLFASVNYAPFIEEEHHARKRDAPSGTAIVLRDIISAHFDAEIPTASTRAGHIPGTHRVGFDSLGDQVLLTHTARSRAGFASGALLAAKWIVGRKGVFEFSQIFDF
ncbi:MAG: dihydrodipicolinate reductase [Blastocatellia bacterium]|nr:MAG: dihydrodipicolinate reductase [Blastocatellia bacterium]